MDMDTDIGKKSKRRKKGKSKISFEAEVVTKNFAKEFVCEGKERLSDEAQVDVKRKPKKEKRKIDNKKDPGIKELNNSTTKKQKLNDEVQKENTVANTGEAIIADTPEVTQEPVTSKKESNRSLKRKKHAQLMENRKVKVELELQQKALNYLSKWKHNRPEWKFEKLKQVWLQQNLFDSSKIPNEFWDSLVEYFSGAKGQSRQTVLDEAIKLVEQEEASEEENNTEDYGNKLKRARDIVQNLQ